MPSLLIPDFEEKTMNRLRERAAVHGTTPETEAKVLLEAILQAPPAPVWAQVNAFRHRLATSGRSFADSAEALHEDRER